MPNLLLKCDVLSIYTRKRRRSCYALIFTSHSITTELSIQAYRVTTNRVKVFSPHPFLVIFYSILFTASSMDLAGETLCTTKLRPSYGYSSHNNRDMGQSGSRSERELLKKKSRDYRLPEVRAKDRYTVIDNTNLTSAFEASVDKVQFIVYSFIITELLTTFDPFHHVLTFSFVFII